MSWAQLMLWTGINTNWYIVETLSPQIKQPVKCKTVTRLLFNKGFTTIDNKGWFVFTSEMRYFSVFLKFFSNRFTEFKGLKVFNRYLNNNLGKRHSISRRYRVSDNVENFYHKLPLILSVSFLVRQKRKLDHL